MKKHKIYGIAYLLLGLLIAIGPQTIFRPCSTEEKIMKCFWSCKALIILGGLLALAGLLSLLFADKKAQLVCSIMAAACAIGSLAIPMWVIGGCTKETMACRMITFPAIYAIAGVALLLSAVHVLQAGRKGQ